MSDALPSTDNVDMRVRARGRCDFGMGARHALANVRKRPVYDLTSVMVDDSTGAPPKPIRGISAYGRYKCCQPCLDRLVAKSQNVTIGVSAISGTSSGTPGLSTRWSAR